MEPRTATLIGPGLTLTFREQDDVGAVRAYLTDVAGWYGGVGTKGDSPERTGHGLFPVPSTRTGRMITLKGTLVFASQEDRALADRALSSVLWDGEFGTLTVNDGMLTLSAQVKLDGEIRHAYVGTNATRVEIPLNAPDPFLYGEERAYQIFPAGFGEGLRFNLFSTGGVLSYGNSTPTSYVAIRNGGRATAWPRFAVRGNFPSGFRLSSGGRTVEYPQPVYAQSPVFIDMATGSITVNGRDQTSAATLRQWFSVPADGVIQPSLTGLEQGDGWADVLISDTYI